MSFKFLARTSRDSLKSRQVYYIVVRDLEKKGIGEVAMLSGLSMEDGPQFLDKLYEIETYNSFPDLDAYLDFPSIRFGLEMAKKDFDSQENCTYYDGPFLRGEKKIPINGLIWMGNKEEMMLRINDKLNEGYRCLKLKIGGINWSEELELLTYIRDSYSSNDLELRVDANGGFGVNEIDGVLDQLAELDIHSIEQPIAAGQITEMANLCQQTPIPIALDEELIGINSTEERSILLDQISPQYLILKPTLLGGFTSCEDWISTAENNEIGWWVTSALESNIGLNAIAQWVDSLETDAYQGLGTGKLYSDNIPSPLYENAGWLQYDRTSNWDLTSILQHDA